MQRARPRSTAWILACCCGSLLALLAHAQEWPQWRGANRDAKVIGFEAPKVWPKELTEAWKVTVGNGVATPALVGDRLYVFAREGNSEVTRCLDANTGKELWKDSYDAQPASGPAGSFPGPRSSPAVADGKVVTLGVRGMLSCLDAKTGQKLWRKDDFNGATPNFFVSSSPLIDGGVVYAQLGGRGEGGIIAYDLATGEQKWKWSGEAPANASPSLMDLSGTKLIIALTERKMVAVTASDGKQVWEAPFAAMGMGGYNASTPVVDGQTLIYSGGGRGTKAVKFEKDGDAIKATELWSNPDKSVQFNTPIVKDGKVYALSSSNELFCLNEQDGKTLWTSPALAAGGGGMGGMRGGPGGGRGGPGGPGGGPGGPPATQPTTRPSGEARGPGGPGGPGGGGFGGRRGGGGMRGGGGRGGGFGSVIDAGSVLLALTPGGEMVVFQPGDTYAEIAKVKVADTPTHAYPIVSGNRLYVKDQDAVRMLMIK